MFLIFLLTFILSFCSIVYELLLGQSLSAFLGNTVLRYCVTIGLYMFSMGMGAFMAEGRIVKNPALTLIRTELLLIFTGGLSVIHLHMVNIIFSGYPSALSFFSHLLIIFIGIMTGFELPLLMEIFNKIKKDSDNVILGISYSGAFCGTFAFAFIFYPRAGLVPSALFTGVLNAIASLLLLAVSRTIVRDEKERLGILFLVNIILLVTVSGLLFSSESVNDILLKQYISI